MILICLIASPDQEIDFALIATQRRHPHDADLVGHVARKPEQWLINSPNLRRPPRSSWPRNRGQFSQSSGLARGSRAEDTLRVPM